MYLIHEKFWPRSECCLFRDQNLISSPYLPCKQLVVTSNTGPILCFPGSILLVVMIHPPLEECIHDMPPHETAWNCVKSPVSLVMKYCPILTTRINPASIQKLNNLSCFESLSIRSSYCFDRKFWYAGSSFCEGDGDVVGVVTPLRGVAQVVLHGVQVVEVGVRLRVHQDRGVEEDGEGQVEAEREEGEVKEKRSCMTMG